LRRPYGSANDTAARKGRLHASNRAEAGHNEFPILVGILTKLVNTADRRQTIIQAGITVLREHGFAAFTQPRVAREAGVRQGHLTYYYPTRVDLLKAVARAAIDRQLSASNSVVETTSPKTAAAELANVIVRQGNTRVLMALAQASDQEPALRELFVELADGIIQQVGKLLERLDVKASDEHCFLVHAVSVGMAVIALATGRDDSERRSARALERIFKLLRKASAHQSVTTFRKGN
jgi:AcrR family transcriptional regulator